MTNRYTEEEALATVPLLTRSRLVTFLETEVVTPLRSDSGLYFRRVDLARMELLCELSEHFDLAEDALEIVISLIDQLHGARARLRALAAAIESQPAEVRESIAEMLLAHDV